MPRKSWTPEQKQALRERLAKGRVTARANRELAGGAGVGGLPSADWEPPFGRSDNSAMDDPKDDGVTITEGGPSLAEIRDERRSRLTGDLPPDLAALITDDELEKIEREEIAKAIASKTKQALAEVRALASAEARIEHGLVPADVLRSEAEKSRLAEKIMVRTNLPRGGGAPGIRVDGRLFRHGQVYHVTIAEFESMHPTVYRMWFDEIRFRTLDQNERGRSAIDQISANPPQFAVLG